MSVRLPTLQQTQTLLFSVWSSTDITGQRPTLCLVSTAPPLIISAQAATAGPLWNTSARREVRPQREVMSHRASALLGHRRPENAHSQCDCVILEHGCLLKYIQTIYLLWIWKTCYLDISAIKTKSSHLSWSGSLHYPLILSLWEIVSLETSTGSSN